MAAISSASINCCLLSQRSSLSWRPCSARSLLFALRSRSTCSFVFLKSAWRTAPSTRLISARSGLVYGAELRGALPGDIWGIYACIGSAELDRSRYSSGLPCISLSLGSPCTSLSFLIRSALAAASTASYSASGFASRSGTGSRASFRALLSSRMFRSSTASACRREAQGGGTGASGSSLRAPVGHSTARLEAGRG